MPSESTERADRRALGLSLATVRTVVCVVTIVAKNRIKTHTVATQDPKGDERS